MGVPLHVPACNYRSAVYKEKALGRHNMNGMYLNGWVAMFQFIFSLILSIPSIYAQPGLTASDFTTNIGNGFKCYFGNRHCFSFNFYMDHGFLSHIIFYGWFQESMLHLEIIVHKPRYLATCTYSSICCTTFLSSTCWNLVDPTFCTWPWRPLYHWWTLHFPLILFLAMNHSPTIQLLGCAWFCWDCRFIDSQAFSWSLCRIPRASRINFISVLWRCIFRASYIWVALVFIYTNSNRFCSVTFGRQAHTSWNRR